MLNEKIFREIYAEYLESGLTIRAYCFNHQMNESRFYYWQKKLKNVLPASSGFVPVIIENGRHMSQVDISAQNLPESGSQSAASNRPISCEINYPNGVSLKLSGLPDAQTLKSLLVIARR